jgi:quercetin 2,3-dioxygenase
MIEIRMASERGVAEHGWLSSRHTFSFADYNDPEQMGFSDLRVINDDRVAPGRGFGTHAHRDMEILSYVLAGALEHSDTLGNGSVIRPGDVQMMSAGTGVSHSERNPSANEVVHFLQIWILPEAHSLSPQYQQSHVSDAEKRGRLRLIASRDGRHGSLTVHQDVDIYAGLFDNNEAVTFPLATERAVYVHVVRGNITINDVLLSEGDGIKVREENELRLESGHDAEVLLFNLRP